MHQKLVCRQDLRRDRHQDDPHQIVRLRCRAPLALAPQSVVAAPDPSARDPLRDKTVQQLARASRQQPARDSSRRLQFVRYENSRKLRAIRSFDQFVQKQVRHRPSRVASTDQPKPRRMHFVRSAPEKCRPSTPRSSHESATRRFASALNTHRHGRQTAVHRQVRGAVGSLNFADP